MVQAFDQRQLDPDPVAGRRIPGGRPGLKVRLHHDREGMRRDRKLVCTSSSAQRRLKRASRTTICNALSRKR
jgi:hypothetical protein